MDSYYWSNWWEESDQKQMVRMPKKPPVTLQERQEFLASTTCVLHVTWCGVAKKSCSNATRVIIKKRVEHKNNTRPKVGWLGHCAFYTHKLFKTLIWPWLLFWPSACLPNDVMEQRHQPCHWLVMYSWVPAGRAGVIRTAICIDGASLFTIHKGKTLTCTHQVLQFVWLVYI